MFRSLIPLCLSTAAAEPGIADRAHSSALSALDSNTVHALGLRRVALRCVESCTICSRNEYCCLPSSYFSPRTRGRPFAGILAIHCVSTSGVERRCSCGSHSLSRTHSRARSLRSFVRPFARSRAQAAAAKYTHFRITDHPAPPIAVSMACALLRR